MRRNHCVLRCFFDKALKMYRKYQCFWLLLLPALNANRLKTLVFAAFWQDKMQKKTRCLEAIFRDFSARAPQAKNQWFFTLFLPPLIQTQEGVKSEKIAKLNLKSTFFMSQSLPQSSRAKKWGRLSGPQNAVNYYVLWTYHAFYLHNKGPPPL